MGVEHRRRVLRPDDGRYRSAEVKRIGKITFKVTANESRQIRAAAEQRQQTISEFVRHAIGGFNDEQR